MWWVCPARYGWQSGDPRPTSSPLFYKLHSITRFLPCVPCNRTKFSVGDELRPREEVVGYIRSRATIGYLAAACAASQLQHEGREPGVAEEILTAVLDWVSVTSRNRNTPLIYAAGLGNIELVDILLQYGVDFQVRTHDDETALSMAVTYSHASAAERILKECHAQVSLPLGTSATRCQ